MSKQNNNTFFKTSLTLRYDGKKFDEHSINAFELAQSIRGMADSIEEANSVLNGIDVPIDVNVNALKDGCFGVSFDILQSTVQTVDVLKILGFMSGGVVATAGAKSLCDALAKFKGKKIEQALPNEDNKKVVTLVMDDGSSFELDENIATLALNDKIRKGISEVISKPLKGEADAAVVFGETVEGEDASKAIEQLKIDSSSSQDFKKPGSVMIQKTVEKEIEKDLVFTKINLLDAKGWAAQFPDREIRTLKMEDPAFIEGVKKSQHSFDMSTKFSVQMIEKTVTTGTVEKKTYTVTFVRRQRSNKDNMIIQ